MSKGNSRNRLEDAARAGWLYYVAQNTQDEIAEKMGVSRQSAQRLVALAMRERLVKFRLDHPMARCMDLAEALKQKFDLDYCEVTLTDPTSDDPALGIAQVAAQEMENQLKSKEPIVVALGTGREIRGAVDQMLSGECPHHRIVSLVGSLAPDGSANFNDPITRIGDLTKAPRHPLPVPVLASSREERDLICAQTPVKRNIQLAQSATIAFIGIGELTEAPPLLTDGFITEQELQALQSEGAAGEVIGWAFDDEGLPLQMSHNDRVASVPLSQPPAMPTIGVARGPNKLRAIRGALKGRWLSGLITDEFTAEALVK